MKTLTALLLAGGLSRRMGRDKATLMINGEPLWRRQLRILGELQPSALWISARTVPPWRPPGLEVVLDESPSRGPLSGLAAGLSRLQTSHLLLLAVDLPCITASHLRRLWSLAKPGSGAIPQSEESFEPLCAVYPAEASPLASEALSGTDVSLQHFIGLLLRQSLAQAHALSAQERPLYLNLNAPEDLCAMENLGAD